MNEKELTEYFFKMLQEAKAGRCEIEEYDIIDTVNSFQQAKEFDAHEKTKQFIIMIKKR